VPALAIGVSRFEVDGLRKEVDINAFLDGLVNFFADGRHFLASSPVDDTDAFGSQAQGRTGSVHRCVATPNHDDVFAVNAHATLMHVVKEIDSLFHGVRAMHSKLQFALQLLAGGDQHGVVIARQLEQGPSIYVMVGLDFNAKIENAVDFAVDQFLRQAKFRNSGSQEAADFRVGFKNFHVVAEACEMISGCKACGP
jgi:hypothetical protein